MYIMRIMYILISCEADPEGGEVAEIYSGFAGRTSLSSLEGKVLKSLLITDSYVSLESHFGLRDSCYRWQFTAVKKYNWLRGG